MHTVKPGPELDLRNTFEPVVWVANGLNALIAENAIEVRLRRFARFPVGHPSCSGVRTLFTAAFAFGHVTP